MKTEEEAFEKHDLYVKMSMEESVSPIELRFTQINDLTTMKPTAYRAKAVINSMLLGKLEEEQYESAMTISPVGVELAKWGIRETVRLAVRMEKANRDFDWISFTMPPSVLTREDMYTYIQNVLKEEEVEHPQRFCIEFPNTLLLENLKKMRQNLLDLKLLGITLSMDGCAADNCPINSMSLLPLDYVILDKSVNLMLKDDGKRNVLNALMQYIKSMDIMPVITEIQNDEEIKKLNLSDYYGYIPSPLYAGEGSHGAERMVVTSGGEEILE